MKARPKAKVARAATLADVGRMAGVSATTVSALLNHTASRWTITPETRERVIAAADALHYRPNVAAQALVNRRINTVGVVAVVSGGELTDYFLEVFNGILTAANRHGQNTTVFTLRNWSGDLARLNGFCDGRVDGLILLAPTFDPSRAVIPRHTPMVSIHGNRSVSHVVNIDSDEENGAAMMVRSLLERGHRRIMYLAGPVGLIGAERRVRGYQRALADAGVAFDPELQVNAGYTAPLAREAICGWIERHRGEPLPDAVFCANDAAAIGCLEAFAEFGVRVPDDVSVAGFDDTYAAQAAAPMLTSVRQPLADMGAHAVELLLKRISHPESEMAMDLKSIVFPVSVIHRASVANRTEAVDPVLVRTRSTATAVAALP